MPFNWGLLSEQSLANQPQEIRQGLQEQATKQFLLNTLMGGGLRAGYAAAQAVPEQYQTRVEQQQFERNLAQARQRAMEPVFGEAAGPVMPGEQPPQMAVGQRFNPEAFLQQLPSVVAQAGPRAKIGNVKEFAELFPKAATQVKDGVLYSPGGTPIAFAPRQDIERGVQVVGGVASPIPGITSARAQTTLPPLGQGQQYVFDANRNVVGIRNIDGYIQAVSQAKAAETAGTVSQTPQRRITATGAEELYYPTPPALAGQMPFGQPRPQVPGAQAPAGVGGVQTSPPKAILEEGTERFKKFGEQALNSALSAGTRKQSAEYLYNAAEQLDPNVATPFFASAASYLRAIPGVGDQFDSFAGNYNLMNKSRAQGILNGFANVKGNANPQEVRIVENAASNPTQDPKWNTKWISALEIATADKDEARNRFVESYQGDPRQVTTAWSNSPANTRIYNHPMVERFLREQIAANPANPVLPAGFKLQQSRQTGQFFIQKPDGSRIPVAQ